MSNLNNSHKINRNKNKNINLSNKQNFHKIQKFHQIYNLYASMLFIFFTYFYFSCSKNCPIFNFLKPFHFLKQEKLNSLPTFYTTSKTIHRCNIDFEYYDSIYFFQESETNIIQSLPIDINKSNTKIGCVYCPISPAYCEKINIYYFKNATLQIPYNLITSNGDLFFIFKKVYPDITPIIEKMKITPSVGYKYVLHATACYGGNYGHLFTDVLGGLLYLPNWIWSLHPVLITHFDKDLIYFAFTILEFPHITVITPEQEQYIYGEHFFIMTGNEPWHCFGLHTFYIIKQKFRDYFHLWKIKPTKYKYTNKEKGHRYFTNLNEIMEIAREKTGLDWTRITTHFSSRNSYVKSFAETKILVTPSGSIAFNSIYMEDGTGMITLHSQLIDFPQTFFCQCIRIWDIGIIHEYMGHWGQPGPAYCDKVLENIERMKYTVENQRFPNHNLFECSSLSDAKQIYYMYGDNNAIPYDEIIAKRFEQYRNSSNK